MIPAQLAAAFVFATVAFYPNVMTSHPLHAGINIGSPQSVTVDGFVVGGVASVERLQTSGGSMGGNTSGGGSNSGGEGGKQPRALMLRSVGAGGQLKISVTGATSTVLSDWSKAVAKLPPGPCKTVVLKYASSAVTLSCAKLLEFDNRGRAEVVLLSYADMIAK